MSNLTSLAGTFTLDPSHSEIGFTARHAMVTKVRGAFTDFEGTATTGADLAGASIDLTIQVASVATGNTDRDAHLRSADFFDTETYPTIRFVSTDVSSPEDDVLRVTGDLTIKDVTRPVSVDFEYEGTAQDPFGNQRFGLSGSVVVNRKDFGLVWNAALETGGVLVSENVTLEFEISAIQAAAPSVDADQAPVDAVQAPVEAVAPARTAAPTGGFVGWVKNLFQPVGR